MIPVGVHDTDALHKTVSARAGSRGVAVAEIPRPILCDAHAVDALHSGGVPRFEESVVAETWRCANPAHSALPNGPV